MSRNLVPRLSIACFVVVLLTSVAVAVGALRGRAPAPEPEPVDASLVADRSEVFAVRVLRDWDRRRAEAWADGDPDRLAALYVDGSDAGRTDVEMLRAYLDRGLRVPDLRTQLLSVEVLRRTEERLRLRVTDRVRSATAVAADGSRRHLPRDSASVRTVTLRLVDEEWRVAGVVDADPV